MSKTALSIWVAILTVLIGVTAYSARPIEPPRLSPEEIDKRVAILADIVNRSPLESDKKVVTDAIDGAVEAFAPLSEEMEARNAEIKNALKKERLDLILPTLPKWVGEHLSDFESRDDFGAELESSIAWGTGYYREATFYWFAYAGTHGALQMDLSTRLREDETLRLYGFKPGEIERPNEEPNAFDADNAGGPDHIPGTATHIIFNEAEDVDWAEEFCLQPATAVCDTVGAFEKHVLSKMKQLLPELKFELKGAFPK